MAESNSKCKKLSKSSSVESSEPGSPVAKSIRERKVKKTKERWLLTRKTWRYMADAGRKLIPDGAQNTKEDIPKIEAHFQEICKKEPRFLLWRKNSYPGALGFRSKKRKDRRKGTYRKTYSVDEIDDIKLERPKDLPLTLFHQSPKKDLPSPTSISLFGESSKSTDSDFPEIHQEEPEEKLISMLEDYLTLQEKEKSQAASTSRQHFNYLELVEKLQQHLKLVSSNYTAFPNLPTKKDQVHFEGDHVQKSLSETLSRYFSQCSNRDKIISDLLTDRKTLEKLYFDLRKSRGFRGRRSGGDYSSNSATNSWHHNLRHRNDPHGNQKYWESSSNVPTPLIEVQNESLEITYQNLGTQTLPIPESVLNKLGEEYKKALAEKEEEEKFERKQNHTRRRSSVDHDDVSQSVSDTIKRYLRMARKKSVDSDKADRFKRVNYDRNLRNIKAKGEITKPGDDDGLNKGCQTNDDWILTYRDLRFDEIDESREYDSCVTSSRSSIDVGVVDDPNKSLPCSPPGLKQSHSFLSSLLHGKHDKHDKHDKSNSSAVSAGVMQKSKSSSSVIHHGSRLVAKKIFSRSKSQTRAVQHSSWTPQGGCVWTNVSGREVALSDTSLLHLSEIERKVLQKVSLAKLQALNLGVSVKIPTESVGVVSKPKKRPYLLKRKAATTSVFDTNRKDVEKDKDGNITGGLVFGISLTQCIENDRLAKIATDTSPFRSAEIPQEEQLQQPPIGRHGSRTSFSSLIDSSRGNDSGSCENLSRERLMGSVPGLLDTISCNSATDITSTAAATEEEFTIPNILNVCFRHLETYGLHTLGIFRVSTSKKRIRQLREDFDCGKETTLDEDQCPHDVATLLKEYLRDLPDPLLCRDLYHAFVQTQRIRNRRLQFEALQHLIQLLPPANRNTLWALLNFLSIIAKHSSDAKNASGEIVSGNKMDSNNLATVFAPNILHCIKPGSKDSGDRPEDRIDVINVVRTLIDNFQQLFKVPAELLDEVYVHMMDSHPEELDQLLNKRDGISITVDESVDDMDSESSSAPWTPTQPTSDVDRILQAAQSEARNASPEPKKTYSREEFLHEAAATGGPNVTMRIRHKDRIRERSSKKRRDESLSQRARDEDSDRSSGSSISSAMTIISRLRGQKDDNHYRKLRSSSIESNSSVQNENDFSRVMCVSEDSSQGSDRRKSSPYVLDKSGVITASLTIPVQTTNQTLNPSVEDDIPYIEDGSVFYDGGKQQMTIGVVKRPSVPPRRRQRSISGSDSSNASNIQTVTGSLSLMQQSCDSALGSSTTFSIPLQNTPPSVSSSIADVGVSSTPTSWASTPPTSPDSTNLSVNYIPDDAQQISTPKSSPKQKSVASSQPVLQKVSFTTTSEVQQVKQPKPQETKQHTSKLTASAAPEIQKSPSTPAVSTNNNATKVQGQEREQKFSPSITSIGNAVLRSRTADFERIAKTEEKTITKTVTKTTVSSEKKKYTKRRYTDSRHQTRHIPDSETLEATSSSQTKKEVSSASHAGPVYKRRELISSVPTK